MTGFDLLVIGAGPAGMQAAITAAAQGLRVVVMDEQPSPGGQIWRNHEAASAAGLLPMLGPAYGAGAPVIAAFRAAAVEYLPQTRVWNLEQHAGGFRVFYSRNGAARSLQANRVVVATGAQERPAPFPGWTLPGVMTLGAAQILLKTSGQIPQGQVWIAGAGPLILQYAVQFLAAGGRLAGIIDTSARLPLPIKAKTALQALPVAGKLAKGLAWQAKLKLLGVRVIRGQGGLQAQGQGRTETLTYRDAQGQSQQLKADSLLIHQGIIPSLRVAQLMHCDVIWHEAGGYMRPKTTQAGESSVPGLFMAGDSVSAAGADAALARGRIAGLSVAVAAGKLPQNQAVKLLQPAQKALAAQLRLARLVEVFYGAHKDIITPPDDTIICRCEELTAGHLREMARRSADTNQLKAFTRSGMGPCQAQQCGLSAALIIAQAQGGNRGLMRVRPPLKPLTLGELAKLDQPEAQE